MLSRMRLLPAAAAEVAAVPLTTLALAGLNTAVPPAAVSAVCTGLYSATPPLSAVPFCSTMTLSLPPVPALTVLMTPGRV